MKAGTTNSTLFFLHFTDEVFRKVEKPHTISIYLCYMICWFAHSTVLFFLVSLPAYLHWNNYLSSCSCNVYHRKSCPFNYSTFLCIPCYSQIYFFLAGAESGETVSSSRRIVIFGGCTTGGYAGDCAGKLRLVCLMWSDYFYSPDFFFSLHRFIDAFFLPVFRLFLFIYLRTILSRP